MSQQGFNNQDGMQPRYQANRQQGQPPAHGAPNQSQHQQHHQQSQHQPQSQQQPVNTQSPPAKQPYLKNEDLRRIQKQAIQGQPISFDNLISMKSFKICSDREYHLTMLLSKKLTQELTKYKLAQTTPEMITKVERSAADYDESV